MGDAADILGVKKEKAPQGIESALGGSSEPKKRGRPPSSKPPSGVSREVYALLGLGGAGGGNGNAGPGDSGVPAMLPSMAPAPPRFKDRKAPPQKWEWAKYQNSARGTDTQPFYRWHKVGMEYLDYPYARFDVKLGRLDYSDSEYAKLLESKDWSREESDALAQMAHKFDLRWPVIFDRWDRSPPRRAEELQFRYLTMAQTLLRARSSDEAALAATQPQVPHNPAAHAAAYEAKALSLGVSLGTSYDLPSELARRAALDQMFTVKLQAATGAQASAAHAQSAAQEGRDSKEVKQELKQVEAELKRVAKTLKEKEAKEAEQGASKERGHEKGPKARGSEGKAKGAAGEGGGEGGDGATLPPVSLDVTQAVAQATAEASRLLGLEKPCSTEKAAPPLSQAAAQPAAAGAEAGPAAGGDSSEALEEHEAALAAAATRGLKGRPYRTSQRLEPPTEERMGKGQGLSRQLLGKMDAILQEVGVPVRPTVATRAVCDAYDYLRRDAVTLISLRKLIDRGVAEAAALRQELEAPHEADAADGTAATAGSKAKRKGGAGGAGPGKKRAKKA
mmetsp:Transcript_31601/g.71037  ORF Transcript_31601/g.71037 Transcript_31601/m.71037 type:complete len:563 (-) Transcript_31601:179-1867(-)